MHVVYQYRAKDLPTPASQEQILNFTTSVATECPRVHFTQLDVVGFKGQKTNTYFRYVEHFFEVYAVLQFNGRPQWLVLLTVTKTGSEMCTVCVHIKYCM